MSPSSQFHAKKEITYATNNKIGLLPPPLKISKGSHHIKKSPSSLSPPSSSSSSSLTSSASSSMPNTMMTPAMASTSKMPPQRHPVIIYTHSPKIIHTHPGDFMSLVQKLTGLSRSSEEDDDGGINNNNLPQQPHQQKQEKKLMVGNDDNETSSVISEENNCCSSIGENQVNSGFIPTIVEPPTNPYMANLSSFNSTNTTEFMSTAGNEPMMNYSDPLFFPRKMRTSIPSSSLEGMSELHELYEY